MSDPIPGMAKKLFRVFHEHEELPLPQWEDEPARTRYRWEQVAAAAVIHALGGANDPVLNLRNEVKQLRTDLEAAAHRFRSIRDETKCIGSSLCHVDGNCPHCVADFSARKIASRLGEK